jgi:two-component system sensor histidine kinase HydH
MKITVKTTSIAVAFLSWLLLFTLTVFIIWSMRDRARLIRDNDNERIFNMLFANLQGYDSYAAAIEANAMLKERIKGFAIYEDALSPVYQWGKVPAVFDEAALGKKNATRFGRYTIPERIGNSVKFILRFERTRQNPPRGAASGASPADIPPPAYGKTSNSVAPYGALLPQPPAPQRLPDTAENEQQRNARQRLSLFNAVSSARYVYIDILHPQYWQTRTLTAIAAPLFGLLFLLLVFYVRRLYLRNREYRDRIEAQQNLVVLGTAASTLAHEIKNPLLSIRLQTGILRKIFTDTALDELGIIEEEIDRISALIYRVNDYLREPKGSPVPINVPRFLAETSMRLCSRNIVKETSVQDAFVFMDADRLRSVLENIIRNSLESGGPEDSLKAAVERVRIGGRTLVAVSIFDRGKGIPFADRKRIFDPFFTSKSTGTGIGLSISKRFVEAASGAIALVNREEGGVKATITLPEYIEG